MMLRATVLLTATCLSITASIGAAECKQIGEMTGTVDTINVSPTLQYGIADITVTKEGKPYFSQMGVIVGEVVAQNGSQTTLNHTIFFADGTRLETEGDTATLTEMIGSELDGTPCAFNVEETITKVWADRKLKRLSNDQHQVTASGSISFCSYDNQNQFDLDGTVCFK